MITAHTSGRMSVDGERAFSARRRHARSVGGGGRLSGRGLVYAGVVNGSSSVVAEGGGLVLRLNGAAGSRLFGALRALSCAAEPLHC